MKLLDAIRKAKGRLRHSKKHRHQAEPHSTRREKLAKRTRFWRKRLAYLKRKLAQRQANKPSSVLNAVLDNARWGVANEPFIHYRQSRPIDGHGQPHKLPLYTDCSGSTIDYYEWSGGPDPSGRGFDSYGFTGDMLANSQHISKNEAKAGEYCVYGNYPGEHVVILAEDGSASDPLTYSHGQEAGPMPVRHSVEVAAHGYAPAYFLRAV